MSNSTYKFGISAATATIHHALPHVLADPMLVVAKTAMMLAMLGNSPQINDEEEQLPKPEFLIQKPRGQPGTLEEQFFQDSNTYLPSGSEAYYDQRYLYPRLNEDDQGGYAVKSPPGNQDYVQDAFDASIFSPLPEYVTTRAPVSFDTTFYRPLSPDFVTTTSNPVLKHFYATTHTDLSRGDDRSSKFPSTYNPKISTKYDSTTESYIKYYDPTIFSSNYNVPTDPSTEYNIQTHIPIGYSTHSKHHGEMVTENPNTLHTSAKSFIRYYRPHQNLTKFDTVKQIPYRPEKNINISLENKQNKIDVPHSQFKATRANVNVPIKSGHSQNLPKQISIHDKTTEAGILQSEINESKTTSTYESIDSSFSDYSDILVTESPNIIVSENSNQILGTKTTVPFSSHPLLYAGPTKHAGLYDKDSIEENHAYEKENQSEKSTNHAKLHDKHETYITHYNPLHNKSNNHHHIHTSFTERVKELENAIILPPPSESMYDNKLIPDIPVPNSNVIPPTHSYFPPELPNTKSDSSLPDSIHDTKSISDISIPNRNVIPPIHSYIPPELSTPTESNIHMYDSSVQNIHLSNKDIESHIVENIPLISQTYPPNNAIKNDGVSDSNPIVLSQELLLPSKGYFNPGEDSDQQDATIIREKIPTDNFEGNRYTNDVSQYLPNNNVKHPHNGNNEIFDHSTQNNSSNVLNIPGYTAHGYEFTAYGPVASPSSVYNTETYHHNHNIDLNNNANSDETHKYSSDDNRHDTNIHGLLHEPKAVKSSKDSYENYLLSAPNSHSLKAYSMNGDNSPDRTTESIKDTINENQYETGILPIFAPPHRPEPDNLTRDITRTLRQRGIKRNRGKNISPVQSILNRKRPGSTEDIHRKRPQRRRQKTRNSTSLTEIQLPSNNFGEQNVILNSNERKLPVDRLLKARSTTSRPSTMIQLSTVGYASILPFSTDLISNDRSPNSDISNSYVSNLNEYLPPQTEFDHPVDHPSKEEHFEFQESDRDASFELKQPPLTAQTSLRERYKGLTLPYYSLISENPEQSTIPFDQAKNQNSGQLFGGDDDSNKDIKQKDSIGEVNHNQFSFYHPPNTDAYEYYDENSASISNVDFADHLSSLNNDGLHSTFLDYVTSYYNNEFENLNEEHSDYDEYGTFDVPVPSENFVPPPNVPLDLLTNTSTETFIAPPIEPLLSNFQTQNSNIPQFTDNPKYVENQQNDYQGNFGSVQSSLDFEISKTNEHRFNANLKSNENAKDESSDFVTDINNTEKNTFVTKTFLNTSDIPFIPLKNKYIEPTVEINFHDQYPLLLPEDMRGVTRKEYFEKFMQTPETFTGSTSKLNNLLSEIQGTIKDNSANNPNENLASSALMPKNTIVLENNSFEDKFDKTAINFAQIMENQTTENLDQNITALINTNDNKVVPLDNGSNTIDIPQFTSNDVPTLLSGIPLDIDDSSQLLASGFPSLLLQQLGTGQDFSELNDYYYDTNDYTVENEVGLQFIKQQNVSIIEALQQDLDPQLIESEHITTMDGSPSIEGTIDLLGTRGPPIGENIPETTLNPEIKQIIEGWISSPPTTANTDINEQNEQQDAKHSNIIQGAPPINQNLHFGEQANSFKGNVPLTKFQEPIFEPLQVVQLVPNSPTEQILSSLVTSPGQVISNINNSDIDTLLLSQIKTHFTGIKQQDYPQFINDDTKTSQQIFQTGTQNLENEKQNLLSVQKEFQIDQKIPQSNQELTQRGQLLQTEESFQKMDHQLPQVDQVGNQVDGLSSSHFEQNLPQNNLQKFSHAQQILNNDQPIPNTIQYVEPNIQQNQQTSQNSLQSNILPIKNSQTQLPQTLEQIPNNDQLNVNGSQFISSINQPQNAQINVQVLPHSQQLINAGQPISTANQFITNNAPKTPHTNINSPESNITPIQNIQQQFPETAAQNPNNNQQDLTASQFTTSLNQNSQPTNQAFPNALNQNSQPTNQVFPTALNQNSQPTNQLFPTALNQNSQPTNQAFPTALNQNSQPTNQAFPTALNQNSQPTNQAFPTLEQQFPLTQQWAPPVPKQNQQTNNQIIQSGQNSPQFNQQSQPISQQFPSTGQHTGPQSQQTNNQIIQSGLNSPQFNQQSQPISQQFTSTGQHTGPQSQWNPSLIQQYQQLNQQVPPTGQLILPPRQWAPPNIQQNIQIPPSGHQLIPPWILPFIQQSYQNRQQITDFEPILKTDQQTDTNTQGTLEPAQQLINTGNVISQNPQQFIPTNIQFPQTGQAFSPTAQLPPEILQSILQTYLRYPIELTGNQRQNIPYPISTGPLNSQTGQFQYTHPSLQSGMPNYLDLVNQQLLSNGQNIRPQEFSYNSGMPWFSQISQNTNNLTIAPTEPSESIPGTIITSEGTIDLLGTRGPPIGENIPETTLDPEIKQIIEGWISSPSTTANTDINVDFSNDVPLDTIINKNSNNSEIFELSSTEFESIVTNEPAEIKIETNNISSVVNDKVNNLDINPIDILSANSDLETTQPILEIPSEVREFSNTQISDDVSSNSNEISAIPNISDIPPSSGIRKLVEYVRTQNENQSLVPSEKLILEDDTEFGAEFGEGITQDLLNTLNSNQTNFGIEINPDNNHIVVLNGNDIEKQFEDNSETIGNKNSEDKLLNKEITIIIGEIDGTKGPTKLIIVDPGNKTDIENIRNQSTEFQNSDNAIHSKNISGEFLEHEIYLEISKTDQEKIKNILGPDIPLFEISEGIFALKLTAEELRGSFSGIFDDQIDNDTNLDLDVNLNETIQTETDTNTTFIEALSGVQIDGNFIENNTFITALQNDISQDESDSESNVISNDPLNSNKTNFGIEINPDNNHIVVLNGNDIEKQFEDNSETIGNKNSKDKLLNKEITIIIGEIDGTKGPTKLIIVDPGNNSNISIDVRQINSKGIDNNLSITNELISKNYITLRMGSNNSGSRSSDQISAQPIEITTQINESQNVLVPVPVGETNFKSQNKVMNKVLDMSLNTSAQIILSQRNDKRLEEANQIDLVSNLANSSSKLHNSIDAVDFSSITSSTFDDTKNPVTAMPPIEGVLETPNEILVTPLKSETSELRIENQTEGMLLKSVEKIEKTVENDTSISQIFDNNFLIILNSSDPNPLIDIPTDNDDSDSQLDKESHIIILSENDSDVELLPPLKFDLDKDIILINDNKDEIGETIEETGGIFNSPLILDESLQNINVPIGRPVPTPLQIPGRVEQQVEVNNDLPTVASPVLNLADNYSPSDFFRPQGFTLEELMKLSNRSPTAPPSDYNPFLSEVLSKVSNVPELEISSLTTKSQFNQNSFDQLPAIQNQRSQFSTLTRSPFIQNSIEQLPAIQNQRSQFSTFSPITRTNVDPAFFIPPVSITPFTTVRPNIVTQGKPVWLLQSPSFSTQRPVRLPQIEQEIIWGQIPYRSTEDTEKFEAERWVWGSSGTNEREQELVSSPLDPSASNGRQWTWTGNERSSRGFDGWTPNKLNFSPSLTHNAFSVSGSYNINPRPSTTSTARPFTRPVSITNNPYIYFGSIRRRNDETNKYHRPRLFSNERNGHNRLRRQ